MAINEYRIISLGHQEIFGTEGMTLDEIKDTLRQYDLNALIEFSSKLGIIMFQTAGGPSELKKGQANIIPALYPNATEREAFVELLKKAINRTEADSWSIFSKHSALLFLKLALENSPMKGGNLFAPEKSAELAEIAKVLFSITDYIDGHDFNPTTLVLPDNFRRVQLREYMFRRLVFTIEEKYPNPLYRNMKIIEYLMTQHKEFDFSEHFEKATGVSLKTFHDISTMLAMKWGIKKEAFHKDENYWFIYKNQHFQEVSVDKSTLERIYALLIFDLKGYKDLYDWSVRVLAGKDIYDYNYLFLRKFPLLEIGENILTCPSPEYLIAKVTEGPYMIVSDYLKDSGDTKAYNLLPSLWGEAFEHYADIRLQIIFGKNYRKVSEEKSKRADGIYEGKQSVLLFEEKSIHISYKASVTGNDKDLAIPLGQCFGKKKGIAQAVSHAKDIVDGRFTLKEDIGKRKILPILITSDFLPSEPFHYMFFEKLLRANGVKFAEPHLKPFIYLTIEEVEYLEAMAEETSVDDIEQLLLDYSDKISKADLNNDFSFKNYLFANGIKIPLNRSLMDDFDRHIKVMMKQYFHKSPEEIDEVLGKTKASKEDTPDD